jgi:hypothetical protein
VVVAPVDQHDLGVGMSQRVRRRQPGEAGAHDDDALALSAGRLDGGCCLVTVGFN